MNLRPTRIKASGSYIIATLLPFIAQKWAESLLPISLLVSAGIILNAEVKRARYRYKISDKELISESGILRKDKTTLSLHNIVKINVEQGLLQRMLNYGHIELETKSRPLKMHYIPKPELIASRIKELKKGLD